jgi:glycosyltransferase involved in cell wall biosynthesis
MRISIITPSYQQATYLEDCLRSVADQDHPDVEHIVVDGGSTDGSVEVITRHAHSLAWWCSEPDAGQAAALNKGLAHATGEVFGWINSDDLLLPGALRHVAAIFLQYPHVQVVTGARIRRMPDGGEELLPTEYPGDQHAWYVSPQVNQQATFWRMSALRSMGGVEAGLHYVMDLELWWRLLFLHGTDAVHITDRPLGVFRIHADSKTSLSQPLFVRETATLLHAACLQVSATDLAGTIAMGYQPMGGVRVLPVFLHHREMVEEMTVHFLLKWDRGVFTRDQYRMMRHLLRTAGDIALRLPATQRLQWKELQRAMRLPGWFAHRLRLALWHRIR